MSGTAFDVCPLALQTVAMLETLRRKHLKNGPFLVIAPVSTLGHWQREMETLTDLYCVVYKGDSNDRHMIRKYDMNQVKGGKGKRFHVSQGVIPESDWVTFNAGQAPSCVSVCHVALEHCDRSIRIAWQYCFSRSSIPS
jgi:hypothetical protein